MKTLLSVLCLFPWLMAVGILIACVDPEDLIRRGRVDSRVVDGAI